MKIGIWIVACMVFLYCACGNQVGAAIKFDYEWTFEPKTDGTVHVEVAITLGCGLPSFGFSFPEDISLEDMQAREAKTEHPIDITENDKGEVIEYILEFKGIKREGFEFIVEYNQSGSVAEAEEIYYFVYNWAFAYETSHTATVILPQNHELLDTDYLEPVKVSSKGNRLSAVFTDEVPGREPFRIKAVFSKKGVKTLEEADNLFNRGQYEEAKKAYQKTSVFYSSFPGVYNRDIASLLLDLMDCTRECDRKLAEESFDEGVAAFSRGTYAEAQSYFQEAQNLYKAAGNIEKFDECQDYIGQCTQILQQEELRAGADELFTEGVDLYGQGQYEGAKAKFEEALAKYTELDDEEKITECQEWIATCEKGSEGQEEETGESEETGGTCTGSSLVFMSLLGAALVAIFRLRNKEKK